MSLVEKTERYEIYLGDCLQEMLLLEEESIDCCVTSPPYWGLRDYGVEGQIGREETLEQYIENLVYVFREVRRVLKKEGSLWLNLGDCFAGSWGNYGRKSIDPGSGQRPRQSTLLQRKSWDENMQRPPQSRKMDGIKNKDLIGLPWMVAFALRADGWYLRSDIVWSKPNSMPESVLDRPTRSHEFIFLMTKSEKYFYDKDAILEPMQPGSLARYQYKFGGVKQETLKEAGKSTALTGFREPTKGRNKRSVWTVPVSKEKVSHFAMFPPELIRPCILAGCPEGGVVLDPFGGSGTTGLVSLQEKRRTVLVEMNKEYLPFIKERLGAVPTNTVLDLF